MRHLAEVEYNPQLDLDLRVEYLRKNIDEETWKIKLQRREKKRIKERMLREIFATYTTVVAGLLGELVDGGMNKDVCLGQCIEILEYCNTQVLRMNKMFNSSINGIQVRY